MNLDNELNTAIELLERTMEALEAGEEICISDMEATVHELRASLWKATGGRARVLWDGTHRVDLLNRHYEFEWPEDAAGPIRCFFISDRHLYACSASVLDLKPSPGGVVDVPEGETVVSLDFNFDFVQEFSIRSCKTNLMSFNPTQKAA